MSAQRLSDRKVRRIAAIIGISNLKCGVAHGGYDFILTTRDHHHYTYNTVSRHAEPVVLQVHYWTCPGGSGDDGDWDLPADTQ